MQVGLERPKVLRISLTIESKPLESAILTFTAAHTHSSTAIERTLLVSRTIEICLAQIILHTAKEVGWLVHTGILTNLI